MSYSCKQCASAFEVTPADLVLLDKLSPVFGGKKFAIPPPTLCPDCRQQRRLFWRNERSLYRRTCDLCKKSIISMYPQGSAHPVYCTECWWSDQWDPLSFGRPFDFSRPFFPQFLELQHEVPRLALNVISNENSEYVNHGGYNKNCYLVFAMEFNEDCLYGYQLVKSRSCVDTSDCLESELCYEVSNVEKCHTVFFARNCSNCSSSAFLYDCKGCSDCLLCTNLRNKRNYIRNRECSREEFAREKKILFDRIARGELPAILREFHELEQKSIHRAREVTNCENVTGDYLKNSRNLRHCFDLSYGEDSAYVYTGFQIRDLLDVCHTTDAQLGYESLSLGYGSYNTLFTHGSWSGKNLLYCDVVQSGSDMFGCVFMRASKYCILNKQCTQEEYERTVPKIIEHMQKTGEWGEFFPAGIAPFAYNETTASLYFPLTAKEARAKGFPWREAKDEPLMVSKTILASKLPPSIDDIPDDILNWAITCEATARPFKIVKQELEFYREHRLPVPHFHPDERHRRRMALRNPRRLWSRKCAKCQKPIETTYAPERPETVYCENCYLKEVY
jgi:hypothetical protein